MHDSDLIQQETQRLRYWHGQMLRSRDLQDHLNIEAQLRWWHNRAVHHAYGVSTGLEVSEVLENNNLKAIRIRCGIAYDCFGRELILQSNKEIAIPRQAPEGENILTLYMHYKKTHTYPQRRELPGVCLETTSSMFLEEPEFTWKADRHIDVSLGVPLVRIDHSGGNPVLDETFVPPRSRALARPHMASGATIPGNTAWEPWEESDRPVGIQVKIDTSAAGFTETPCYFAWLQGPLWTDAMGPDEKLNSSDFFPAPLSHIHDPGFNGFTFRLWGPKFDIPWLRSNKKANEEFINEFMTFAQRQGLYVCWLGIQPQPVFKPECEDHHESS